MAERLRDSDEIREAVRESPVSPHRPEPDAGAIAECRLDLAGLRGQRDRYRALARHVTAVDRCPAALEVRFGPGLDDRLLDETLRVERECCPFFRLDYDPVDRTLSVSVEHAGQEPALEAIGYALTA